jgi:hypothetical protein
MLMRLTRHPPVKEEEVHELFFPSGYRETKGGHPGGFLGGLEPAEYRAACDAILRSPSRVFPDANAWLSLAANRGKFIKELILRHVRRWVEKPDDPAPKTRGGKRASANKAPPRGGKKNSTELRDDNKPPLHEYFVSVANGGEERALSLVSSIAFHAIEHFKTFNSVGVKRFLVRRAISNAPRRLVIQAQPNS